MRRFINIFLLVSILSALFSCRKEIDVPGGDVLPEGTPVVLTLGFGADNLEDVKIGTKAEVSRADESRIHDLYVLIFNSSGDKIYGRYFTYEHQYSILKDDDNQTVDLLSQENEGWYVDNLLRTDTDPTKKTRGVVKISTVSSEDCTLILLANIDNTVTSIKDPDDPRQHEHSALDWLSQSDLTLADFNKANVTLEQNVVNRSNLFLMMGSQEHVNTGQMTWDKTNGSSTGNYGTDYNITLVPLDAKIKFLIKYDETNISGVTPHHWKAYNLPDRCMLAPSEKKPSEIGSLFFNTDDMYFEGTETIGNVTWQAFSFYMLESKPYRKRAASTYYDRDRREKEEDGTNKKTWYYAPDDAAYVVFDLTLDLTTEGIRDLLGDPETNHALTSAAKFTVHLGDFTSSQSGNGHDIDNYKVERGHAYTYYITILNSKSIYAEVMSYDSEPEPAHEGSLLLTTDGVVNCDAHYEYHSMTFKSNPALAANNNGGNKLSWYIKSPFTKADEGRPVFENDKYVIPVDDNGIPIVDYKWVKFSLNPKNGSLYSELREPYPGDDEYDPDWDPYSWESGSSIPKLIDVNQLVNLLYNQNNRKYNSHEANLFDSENELAFTAFVDEFYYEVHPLTGELEPDLWRDFINAKPRELHILSQAYYSKDLQSDVITSNHSIIQNSIQTFYNTYSPDLTSIWGTEHKDEMRNRGPKVDDTGVNRSWSWWHGNWTPTGTINDEENGRVNTANIWGMSNAPTWSTFLDYEVDNNSPELKSQYQYMAYSCLTRNRDNNGNGVIDPEELRWYTAAINQLVGLWVGNESISQSARIYQPIDAYSSDPLKWRAHVLSSTCLSSISDPSVIRGEEGTSKSIYSKWSWAFPSGSPQEYRDRVSSIRCVRNAGTFRQNGEDTDISYAPYDHMVDQYYEVPAGTDGSGHAYPNADGTYTVLFSRLNPKSIREYTSDDLPYHEEYSFHNCVYLEMNAQSPDNLVVADGTLNMTQREVNNDVTTTGHNTHCPAGYRLPNMTELVMMSLLMPDDYWGASTTQFPCRTYYSHGFLGDKKDSEKIGWQYTHTSSQINLPKDSEKMNSLRCVRDKDMTGDISGKIIVANHDKLKNGESTSISLNFSSMASAIRSVSLALVYIDSSGEHSISIDEANSVTISGVTVNESFEYTVPQAGTGRKQLPVRGWMKVRAVVRNANGMERTFETPVRVISDMSVSIRLLPCDYDGRNLTADPYPFPVLLTAFNEDCPISAWRVKIVSPDNALRTVELEVPVDNNDNPNAHYVTTTYNYSPNTLLQGTYTFQLEAVSGSETVRSEVISMDILKEQNWDPLEGVNLASVTQASDIASYRWERQMIESLDFTSGDFIETDMDIHRCEYIEVEEGGVVDYDKTLGKDLLFSVGLKGIDKSPWMLSVEFPAVSNGNWGLNVKPRWSTANGGSDGKVYCYPDYEIPAHFRLDNGGAYWNGQKIDVSKWGANQTNFQSVLDRLTAANTLYIGSTEGLHRSRAIYRFIRVVRNGRDSSITGGDSNFKDNPGYGGQL
ncbi:MAG: DUF4906 domain-containing protein [Bacteroidales bacterium]|nr:DUF4906 domain-containing protein [Bacteroidales bacterium]